MDWIKRLFGIRVTRPCNTWPNANNVTIKVLVAVYIMDSFDVGFELTPVGTVLELTRIPNPHGYSDPWLVKTTDHSMGGAERCFREWVETGKMIILSYN